MININYTSEIFKFDSNTLNNFNNINKIQKMPQPNEYVIFEPTFRVIKIKDAQPQKLKGVYDVGVSLHCYSCDAWFEDRQDGKLFHLAHSI